MSYDLFNPSTTICRTFSRQFFAKALDLAELYGWQPMGTEPPSVYDFHKLRAEWEGGYFTNDGQMIKAEDARSLANALERALHAISDAKVEMDWNTKFWIEDDLPEWLAPEEKDMVEDGIENELLDVLGFHPLEFFAGNEKDYLKKFIKFCRMGNFIVL
jgi:hypothetical protein